MLASSWIVFLLLIVMLELLQEVSSATANYTRADFPSQFIFGASTSAYQVEGAALEDGRTPSVMDSYAHADEKYGYLWNTACDEYHKYKEDVKLMTDTGLDAYKFSISWSRLIPNGRGPVNSKAMKYYNNLINELLHHGIQPHVSLLHWDLPAALWDDYGGRMSRKLVKDFTAYADICFREFGDRVLHWTTINEVNLMPLFFCDEASKWSLCTSNKDSYIDVHNLLLAHASAVRLYRTKYQGTQHGHIGLNVYASWFIPERDVKEDLLAAKRVKDFMVGWVMNPLVFGDYPEIMKQLIGNRLIPFTKQESKLVKNSFDFIALNCYTASVVKDHPNSGKIGDKGFLADVAAQYRYVDVGGEVMQHILENFKQDYGNPPIYIHENGHRTERNASLNDISRIEYLSASIGSLLEAVRNGSKVEGYFVWSFLDLLEIVGGKSYGFGLYYVDLDDPDLERYPKSSAYWMSKLNWSWLFIFCTDHIFTLNHFSIFQMSMYMVMEIRPATYYQTAYT